MRSAAKRTVLVILALLVAASLSAWDWGGYVDNTTGVGGQWRTSAELIQRTTGALWVWHRFGAWELDAQGSVSTSPPVTLFLADLDRLLLRGAFPAEAAGARSLGLQAGRMKFADTTGYILDHTLDGLQLSIGWPMATFNAGVGTSALIQKPASGIVMSRQDLADLDKNENDPATTDVNERVIFAPPRLVAAFAYQARGLVAGQDLAVGAVVQEDLRPEAQLTPEYQTTAGVGGRLDTQYVTLQLSGGIIPGLFHRTFYTFNSGRTLTYLGDIDVADGEYRYVPILAHMAGLELTYFLPQVLNSRVRVRGMLSTGEGDGEVSDSYYEGNGDELATAFVPISASSFSDVFTLQPGNSGHVAISYSLRPLSAIGLDILQTELSSVSYFRTAGTGAVSEGAVDAGTVGSYVGTNVDLRAVLQPFSDLRVVLAGGLFFPNAAVMTGGNQNVEYQIALQGVVRF